MSDETRFDPRFDPAFQPGYTGPIASPAPSRRPLIGDPPQPIAAQAVAPEPVEPEPDDEPVARRANPFLIVLGAVAAVLVGGGLYLVSRMRDLFDDTQSTGSFDYVTLQVLMFAAPMLIVLGLATGVALLFVFALRWDRR